MYILGGEVNLLKRSKTKYNYKYENKSRICTIINNQGDENVSEARKLGGYVYNDPSLDNPEIIRTYQVFDRSLVELHTSIPDRYKRDVILYLVEQKSKLINLLNNEIVKDGIINFGFFLKFIIVMSKQTPGSSEELQNIYVNSFRYIINASNLSIIFNKITRILINRIENLLLSTRGSGLIIENVEEFKLCYHRVSRGIRMGHYEIPFPCKRGKLQIFNPKGRNKDDSRCLLKCLACFKFIERSRENGERINWDKLTRKFLNPEQIVRYLEIKPEYLKEVKFDDIPALERLNNIRITIYRVQQCPMTGKHEIDLIRKGNKKFNKRCNLIFYNVPDDENENENITHVVLMKTSFHKFIRNFLQLRRLYVNGNKERVCNYCFSYCQDRKELIRHKKSYCSNKISNTKIIYPKMEDSMKFRNFARTELLKYVQFVDFECELIKNGAEQIHVPVCFSYVIYDTELEKIIRHKSYIGKDCVDVYLESTKSDWSELAPMKRDDKYALNMTPHSENRHQQAIECASCGRNFLMHKLVKQRHHNHLLQ